jgi:AhpD family alkylhydroperoxidase
MQRIPTIDAAMASDGVKTLFAVVTNRLGGVPNVLTTMAQSFAVLDGYLDFSDALARGKFSDRLREQIALTVAGANGCDYSASAHAAIGRRVGVSVAETHRNLLGKSSDPGVASVLALARLIVKERGRVNDADLVAFHHSGNDDESLTELIANISLGILTNYFNHIARTEIDFPHVSATFARA